MAIRTLIEQARTCRRYHGNRPVSQETLVELVDCARLSPSARNAQILRFATANDADTCLALNEAVVYGGAFAPEQRPAPQQKAPAFIAILGPADIKGFSLFDMGIAAQSIHLAAVDAGLACCMIGAFDAQKVTAILGVPENLEVKLLIAVGSPAEERRAVACREDGSLVYYRDENDVHCVPKLSLDELLIIRK